MQEKTERHAEQLKIQEFEKKLADLIFRTKELTHVIYEGDFSFEEIKKTILSSLKTDIKLMLNQFPDFWQNKGEDMTAELYLAAIFEPLEADFNKQSVDGAMSLVRDLDREFNVDPADYLASENVKELSLKLSASAILGDIWYYVFHVLSNRMWPLPPKTHKKSSHDNHDFSYYANRESGLSQAPLFTPEQEEQMTIFFDSLTSPIDPMFFTDGYREAYLAVLDRHDNWNPSGFKINDQIVDGISFDQATEETVHRSRNTVKIQKFLKKNYSTDEEVNNLVSLYEGYWQKNPHTKVGLFYKRRMDFYKQVKESRKLFASKIED